MDGFQRRREQKRNQILQASLELFNIYGIQKVTIAEIAEKAEVSQVTIYNYFDNKQALTEEVIAYYLDREWEKSKKIIESDRPFPDKLKELVFLKTCQAEELGDDFYVYFMEQYSSRYAYFEEFQKHKAIPKMIELLEEGKRSGYVDPSLSNELVLIYIQVLSTAAQKPEIYRQLLPYTEELTKVVFYGLAGQAPDRET